ncbi:hypothetical protein N9054_02030, partial [bacterium]|nr:hypothetical protein [bacterium]
VQEMEPISQGSEKRFSICLSTSPVPQGVARKRFPKPRRIRGTKMIRSSQRRNRRGRPAP